VKISIIGGGWVGCHLALKLMTDHDVTLYEKNEKLFSETSYKNQNRLHMGYHYSRNFDTRQMCKNTFLKFISDYGFLTKKIEKNIYCIPKNESLVDFKTYLKIFDTGFNHKIYTPNLYNMEGCITTEEKYIDFIMANEFFNEKLKDIHVKKNIDKKKLTDLKKQSDLVINCTNNFLRTQKTINEFYELTVSYIYENKTNPDFDALTLVDGKLFSIYPYHDRFFTVTDVELTVLKKFNSLGRLEKYKNRVNQEYLSHKISKLEKKILFYYPNFSKDFEYKTFMLSTKSKVENKSDNRSPVIKVEDNLLNIFTGKIQGIYIVEEFVDNFIKNESSDR
jgi:hypothetical protein